jgi:hypothetical protein
MVLVSIQGLPTGRIERLFTLCLVYWGAWPNANDFDMTTDGDLGYQAALGDKVYMMGVSPYFYTGKSV